MDEAQLAERVGTTAPSCLQGFRAIPAKLTEAFADNPCSLWQVACNCGGVLVQFLGYPLKDYNFGYSGPECFLSPLAFECAACSRITELLDTDQHGYHAELARREDSEFSICRGKGDGPRNGPGAEVPLG